MQINWDNFILNNQNSKGVRFKFEDLCRQLFANENLCDNKKHIYLHANPNNPGLETEPILNEVINKYVGFQAKFFSSNVEYNDIKESAEKIVKYYGNTVDLVYLFCNKSLNTKSLLKTYEILESSDIELQLITDDAILDLIRVKYPYLGLYYFGNHTIEHSWFTKQFAFKINELGDRYNNFNVETNSSIELSLFVHDQNATHYLNHKKYDLLQEIEKLSNRDLLNNKYLTELKQSVELLPDVSTETLCDSIQWKSKIELHISDYLQSYTDKLILLQRKKDKYYDLANNAENKSEKNQLFDMIYRLDRNIQEINNLIDLPKFLEISKREQDLLNGNVLSVKGMAGIGKTQLLANESNYLLNSGRNALFLIASNYYDSNPIKEQIVNNLGITFKLDELIDILETIAERDNCIVPIFIDALNETWNYNLWKICLPEIIDKINSCQMVKLIISYRTEYESLLLSNSILDMNQNGSIINIYHNGFKDNSVLAIKKFLNQYGIPFTPLEYFGYEMSNPLFLKMYCETYDGTEVDLQSLYERLIKKANINIFRNLRELIQKGYTENQDIITPVVLDIAEFIVSNNKKFITRNDLNNLKCWTYYGLTPAIIINQMINEHILNNNIINQIDHLNFTFDQMNDYYCAKVIIEEYSNKDELKNYLSETILGIKDGQIENIYNVDLFINICALYAEKYGEECIDIIDSLEDYQFVLSKYISSFQWRNSHYISADKFKEIIKKYSFDKEYLWEMLIGNSVKITNPLNANFLHLLLSSFDLNKRDYYWTIYINSFTFDESNRVYQLIQLYNQGEKLDIHNEQQIKLLLTLFGWFLTSSNRWLRDNTSKAMIEILKEHFSLCLFILERFKSVNDSYILQRLYGIVFGACCKRIFKDYEEYKNLAEFVYGTVFNQELVYPDILLRDYARLIIERFLYEYPEYQGYINENKIYPPYNSISIPEIKDINYFEQDFKGCVASIVRSMKFDGMGMYGDFGRYVFQSALRSFDVDNNLIFNYSIYFILNELGYSKELFEEYDCINNHYDRNVTVKTERIGKKYQWIAMYNILARVSDHYNMIDRWSYPRKEIIKYEGSWDPYIRDFDPTLNQNFLKNPEAPTFDYMNNFYVDSKSEITAIDVSNQKKCSNWLRKKGYFFQKLKNTIILQDNEGNEWVSLTKFISTDENMHFDNKLYNWAWLYAFFINPEQAEKIKISFDNVDSILTSEITSHHEIYSLYNREYPWSKSCNQFNSYGWTNVSIPKDEKNDSTIEIGNILRATSNLLWEEEFDASKSEIVSINVPCAEIIKILNLEQKNYDGFYYDSEGKLAAFDSKFIQDIGGVVIRRDLLNKFLLQTNMKMILIVQGSKEIHGEDLHIKRWSDWEALYEYSNDDVIGNIKLKKIN